MAEGAALVLDEAEVRELLVAHLAAEALRVPGRAHRLIREEVRALLSGILLGGGRPQNSVIVRV